MRDTDNVKARGSAEESGSCDTWELNLGTVARQIRKRQPEWEGLRRRRWKEGVGETLQGKRGNWLVSNVYLLVSIPSRKDREVKYTQCAVYNPFLRQYSNKSKLHHLRL